MIKNFFITLYNIYIKTFKNCFDFKGRCSRKNFWLFTLSSIIVAIFVLLISKITTLNILYTIYSLILFIPGLSVAVRRFHDSNKSTKLFFFVYLFPFILSFMLYILAISDKIKSLSVLLSILIIQIMFFVYMLYVFLKKGDPEANRYGETDK